MREGMRRRLMLTGVRLREIGAEELGRATQNLVRWLWAGLGPTQHMSIV